MPVVDYPELPELPEISGTVDGAEFAEAVKQVQIAVSKDETLPLLTGIRVEINGDTMTLLATDRYRLAMREIKWNPRNPDVQAAVLLKAKTVSEVGSTLSGSGELSIALPAAGELIGFRRWHPSHHQRSDGRRLPQHPCPVPRADPDSRGGSHLRPG